MRAAARSNGGGFRCEGVGSDPTDWRARRYSDIGEAPLREVCNRAVLWVTFGWFFSWVDFLWNQAFFPSPFRAQRRFIVPKPAPGNRFPAKVPGHLLSSDGSHALSDL